MLADDFWRLAHSDTGACRLNPRGLAYGTAAALIGELIISKHLNLADGKLALALANPPTDATSHTVLDEISAEINYGHPLRTWLDFFGLSAPGRIAARLERFGHVKAERKSRLRGGVIYVPTHAMSWETPRAGLATGLRYRRPMTYEQWNLAAMAWATGLCGGISGILDGAPPEAWRYLQHIADEVEPPIRELVHATRSAISDAALRGR